jgi:hypothetical protein
LTNSNLSLSAQIRRVEGVIDHSGIVAVLENAIEETRTKAGRPREISVRALLVALLVLGMDGREHLIRVVRLLNGLDPKTRKRLGVTRTAPVTRRQVERLYNVITTALEVKAQRDGRTKWEMLDELGDMLLPAAAHRDVAKSSSIAVDGTSVESWGTKRRRRVVGANGASSLATYSSDPDAKWRAKSENAWKRPFFGYDLTAAVSVPDLGGPEVPLAVLSMRFRPATTSTVEMALATVAAVAQKKGALSDVIVDREYTQRNDGADFLMPVRALGGEPVFDLTPAQLGASGTVRGAVIVDGQPFSPSLPPSFFVLHPPAVNASKDELLTYQKSIDARARYALSHHGSRKVDGRQTYVCPAAAGKLRCPLMPSKKKPKAGVLPTYHHPKQALPGTVCANAYTTFGATDLPLAQRELYGSKDWYFSFARRNRVEGFFGNLKNEATENLRRGVIRVRGGMKTGLLTLMIVAASNLRLAERWDERTPSETRKKIGRPAKKVLAPYAEAALQAGRSNAPPSAA